MKHPVRISVRDARQKASSGKALIVCAYEDVEKCRAMKLEGALTLPELRQRGPRKDEEIIFYCA